MKTLSIIILLNLLFVCSNNEVLGANKKPMTIVLSNFSGSAVNSLVTLEWAMFENINTSHFIIEHCRTSLAFIEIGKMSFIESDVNKSFTFNHNSPISDGYSYYRLKIVDNKGGFVYSEIIAVYIEKSKKFDVSILNNPSITETLNISVLGANGKDVKISVRDFAGYLVYATTLNDVCGYVLRDKAILSGTYIITGETEDELVSKKIVITK